VETLLIEQDRHIGGKITDSLTGDIATADLQQADVDDLLDDIGELVTKMGGNVVVIPKEKMPSETGLAAILRY
jgi:stalled ribosome rescue protein Dom34